LTGATEVTVQEILSHKPESRRVDTSNAARYAAEKRRVSILRIGLEMFRLSRGQGVLTDEDYFLLGAWQPGLSWSERLAFLSTPAVVALNQSLTPPLEDSERQRTDNKLCSASLCSEAGLAQPGIRAVAADQRPMGGHRWLDGPVAIKAYLQEADAVPCFAKPVSGRAGQGAVSLEALEGRDHIRLGSGQIVTLDDLVSQIWAKYSDGFLFQEIVRPNQALAALLGPVIGTLRVVTIDAGDGPEPLYAGAKAPAAGAMVDSGAGPLGAYAAVDLQTGRTLRLQDRRQMGGIDLSHFPLTGAKVAGAQLPDFDEAMHMALQAHKVIGNRGILGTDILLSDRGPLLNEVNLNPGHSAYQIASARGILNEDFLPRLRAVRKRFLAVTPRPKLCPLP
jgi:hypothetical protein